MTAQVSGTFANGQSVGVGIRGDVLVIPSGYTSMQLTLDGAIDGSNTVKTRKSTNGGQTWTDQTTYNSAQAGVAVTVAHGEQWVLETVTGQASKQIGYRMECDG
jgi:hypothetical protein